MDQSKIKQLVIQAQNSDTSAFAELIGHTQRFAYGAVYRMIGNAEESKDIVQEAYVRVWTNIRQFNNRVTFQSWFFSILRNLSVDSLRKTKMRQSARLHELTESDHQHPAALYEGAELSHLIRELVTKLPETQQLVFILRDMEDLSIREVQDQTGLSESSIKSNLYQARKKLATWLKINGYPVK